LIFFLALAVASLAKSFDALGINLYNVGCKNGVFIFGTGWSKIFDVIFYKNVSFFLKNFNT